MKPTFSDEEIQEMLELAENEVFIEEINIDERTFNFWFKDPTGRPFESTDLKYSRYVVRAWAYGDCTDDYWVIDTKNPFFRETLAEFIDMDEKGLLPIEVTEEQIKEDRKRKIHLIGYLGFVVAILSLIIYFFD